MELRITKHAIPRQALHEAVNVPLPVGSTVLTALLEGMLPQLYVVSPQIERFEERRFRLLWTSEVFPPGALYVESLQAIPADGGKPAVWHLVELP